MTSAPTSSTTPSTTPSTTSSIPASAGTPAGTPVEITTTVEDGHVEVEVRDHGQGLPSEDPQAIFGRFWRSEGGRTRGRSGAGLGLAIVAAIVEAHDGTVRAADAAGGGASFVVRLPLAQRSRS